MPAASFGFRWGLWMFTINGNQSQGTRQERKGHNKAIVTWGYSIQLKYQARKVRGIGIFLWAFWKKPTIKTNKQKRCKIPGKCFPCLIEAILPTSKIQEMEGSRYIDSNMLMLKCFHFRQEKCTCTLGHGFSSV